MKNQQTGFPRKSTIQNQMIQVRRKLCHLLIYQDCLNNKIDERKKEFPATNIYFRPKGIVHNSLVDATKDSTEDEDEVKLESGTETSLLFVYQSDWQKCLLSRYCNELRDCYNIQDGVLCDLGCCSSPRSASGASCFGCYL